MPGGSAASPGTSPSGQRAGQDASEDGWAALGDARALADAPLRARRGMLARLLAPSAPHELAELRERGRGEHGCAHYRRRCRMVAPCCGEVFWCRHCHNEAKNANEWVRPWLCACLERPGIGVLCLEGNSSL